MTQSAKILEFTVLHPAIVDNYETIKESYKYIKRPDGSLLSTQDKQILDLLIHLTKKGPINTDYPWLSQKLLKSHKTVQRTLKNLRLVFTCAFHNVLVVDGKKNFNQILVTRTEEYEKILGGRQEDLAKNKNQKLNKSVQRGGQKCPEGWTKVSIPIYKYKRKQEITKNRSIKSNFDKNSLEEELLPSPLPELSDNKNQENIQIRSNEPLKFEAVKGLGLKDFYPLSIEDGKQLQSLSNRQFSLNAMNEILLDMSKRLPNRYFKNKKRFINYMADVFTLEMRDAVKISNVNFRIKNNLTKEEINLKEIEKYLATIEYSQQISSEWHFKKKVASVLEASKAYELLTSYKSISQCRGVFTLHLAKNIQLTQQEKKIILKQIKATHTQEIDFEDKKTRTMEDLKIIMPEKTITATEIKTKKSPANIVWKNIRRSLISIYGEQVDHDWFSKLEADVNEETKEIKLKVPTDFVRNWITQNYLDIIEKVTKENQYKISEFTLGNSN